MFRLILLSRAPHQDTRIVGTMIVLEFAKASVHNETVYTVHNEDMHMA